MRAVWQFGAEQALAEEYVHDAYYQEAEQQKSDEEEEHTK